MPKRYNQKFIVRDAWTERHRKSAIPFMQKLLNDEDKERKDILKQIDIFVPTPPVHTSHHTYPVSFTFSMK